MLWIFATFVKLTQLQDFTSSTKRNNTLYPGTFIYPETSYEFLAYGTLYVKIGGNSYSTLCQPNVVILMSLDVMVVPRIRNVKVMQYSRKLKSMRKLFVYVQRIRCQHLF